MSEKQEKKVVGRTVVIALGIICIILVVGLVGAIADYTSIISEKDNAIATKDSQISSLNNTIATQNNYIAQQNDTINRLRKLENLTDQIFYLAPQPYDSFSFEWSGTWNLVATFGGTSFQANTSTFQIFSPYHIWRLNYTQTGEEQAFCAIDVIQVVGSQKLWIKEWQVTGPDSFTSYIFDYSISSPDNYYIEMWGYTGITSWMITVEQLNLK